MKNNFFYWHWENPLTTYDKIKAFFLPLTTKWTWCFGRYVGPRIFGFEARDVSYVEVDGEPHHNCNPIVNISILGIISLSIEFTTGKDWMTDVAYWETAINWVKLKRHLPKALDLSGGWMSYDLTTEQWKESKAQILQDPWQALYNKKKLLKIFYEDSI